MPRASGSHRCRTRPGRSCSCRRWIAGCRSWWISWVARRRDVIDGRTFGATATSRQRIATSRLRECRNGRADRPSCPSSAARGVKSSRVRGASAAPTVQSRIETLAGPDATAGRKSLEPGFVVDDRARQRRQGAVAQVRKALSCSRCTRKNFQGLARHWNPATSRCASFTSSGRMCCRSE